MLVHQRVSKNVTKWLLAIISNIPSGDAVNDSKTSYKNPSNDPPFGRTCRTRPSVFSAHSVISALSPSSFCFRWFCDLVTLSIKTWMLKLLKISDETGGPYISIENTVPGFGSFWIILEGNHFLLVVKTYG